MAETGTEAREQARLRFSQRRWADAHASLTTTPELRADDHLLLAMCAYLLGRYDDCTGSLEHGYHRAIEEDDPALAVRCAFWLTFVLLDTGEHARAGGWLSRAWSLVDERGLDGAERGYLLIPSALEKLYSGDGEAAEEIFSRITAIANRFPEPDLLTLGRLGRGQAFIAQGRLPEAVPLLDEAMLAVTADEVTPVVAGIVYCAVIEACQDTFDVRRAQEWTAALTRWCDSQPDLVTYRGQCQVHRVEILRLHGDWREAMTEVARAREQLGSASGGVGAAIYEEAELHRLQGQLQRAERAYAEASANGHDPQPGLARLRIAQGDPGAAMSSLERALNESPGHAKRPQLLRAYVDAATAANHHAAAAAAAQELASIADAHDVPLLRAMACQAMATVALTAGDASEALQHARAAWSIWRDFGAPYEAARSRVSIARACRMLGDADTARLELAAAQRAFQQLGAQGDLHELDVATERGERREMAGLTPREVEVLRLVARGHTNRAVAGELFLSEKTIARHLSNIYTKLGVSSRAAATAWSYEHHLV